MSSTDIDLRKFLRSRLPPMNYTLHKGQAGRIGVLGGCAEYTGAPFFAAMGALRMGVDLVHIFCTKEASTPLKCYNPELIVHPVVHSERDISSPLESSASVTEVSALVETSMVEIRRWAPRLHVMIVGPGLGADDRVVRAIATSVLKEARATLRGGAAMPLVIDADGLQIIVDDPDLVKGVCTSILTPNKVELSRLERKLGPICLPSLDIEIVPDIGTKDARGALATSVSEMNLNAARVAAVVRALQGPTLLAKLPQDICANTELRTTAVVAKGSPRRPGGQGDVLAGVVAALCAWGTSWDGVVALPPHQSSLELYYCAICASIIVRRAAELAFEDHGRSMTTRNIIERVPQALTEWTMEKGDDRLE